MGARPCWVLMPNPMQGSGPTRTDELEARHINHAKITHRFGRGLARGRGGHPVRNICTDVNCVLLGERHSILADGVRGLLDTTFDAVFMVADEASLLEGAGRLSPTLIVVDLALAGGDLPRLLGAIRQQAPAAKVLLLSVHDESSVATDAVAAGADALVVKRRIASELLPTIDAILAKQPSLSRDPS